MQNRLKFLGLAIAGIFFFITQASLVIEGLISGYSLTIYASYIVEWGHILCLSFILSALAVFIRDSKPVFAQFPMVYSGLPLLIVLSYILVTDTFAIKQWLISIYQGGALVVAILMYSVYSYRNNRYVPVLTGIGLFFITFALYWYVPGVSQSYSWIWKLFLSMAMLLTVIGLDSVNQDESKDARLAHRVDTAI
jgi:hypothetical protein